VVWGRVPTTKRNVRPPHLPSCPLRPRKPQPTQLALTPLEQQQQQQYAGPSAVRLSIAMSVLRLAVQSALFVLVSIYVFFGLIYLFTGIRIKRVGYLSLRWIQWISRTETVVVEIRKIGLRPQRPSITRRTWLGIVVSDATITVRPAPEFTEEHEEQEREEHDGKGEKKEGTKKEKKKVEIDDVVRRVGRLMGKLIQWRVLNWVDLELSSTTLTIEGAGTFQMGMFFLGLNSNPQMFKRERILSPTDAEKSPVIGRPKEVTLTIRDLYFSVNEKEFVEIAKTIVLTVDCIPGGDYGVTEVKAALRIAGFSIPYDNLVTFRRRISEMKLARPDSRHRSPSPITETRPKLDFLDIFDELQVSSVVRAGTNCKDSRHVAPDFSPYPRRPIICKANTRHPRLERHWPRLDQTRKCKRLE
jgi:Mitochondrial protein from FMP27